MPTLSIRLDALLRAKKNSKTQKLELELDASLPEPVQIQNAVVMDVQHVASRYSVSLKGMLCDQIEEMCRHVSSLGCSAVMIQVGDFPLRREPDLKTPVHVDFLGLAAVNDASRYEFHDFMYDAQEAMEVKTYSVTEHGELGPCNSALNPHDLFYRGVIGYHTTASIIDRLDGCATKSIVLLSKDRRTAQDVHAEVLSALRDMYHSVGIENASTKAIEQAHANSKHKRHLFIYCNGTHKH